MGGIVSKFKSGIYGGVIGAVVGGIGGLLLSDKGNRVQSIVGLASVAGAVGFAAGMFIFAPEEKPVGESLKDGATGLLAGLGEGLGAYAEGLGSGIGNIAQGIGGGIGSIFGGVGGIFKKR